MMNKTGTLKKNTRILYIKGDSLYAQTGDRICVSEDLGQNWRFISENLPDKAKSSTNLYSRLTRKGIHSSLFTDDGNMVFTAKNTIYKFDPKQGKITNLFKIPRGSRPLSMCLANDGTILWGEYFRNPDREEVNIYASKDKGYSWEIIYTFPKNHIRHIHGVFCDPYDNKIWVTTGDEDDESAIWVTGNMFETLDKVTGGDQMSRALNLVFTRDYVYFGTDTPYKTNYICRTNKDTFKVERLANVDGSVYWGCKVKDHIFFSTAVEPSKVNKSRYASLWGSQEGKIWKCLRQYKKDIWPALYGQIGQIYLPQGENTTGYLFYTPVATEYNHTLNGVEADELFNEDFK